MPVTLDITLTASNRHEARRKLEDVAAAVERGEFSACCTPEQCERFGGTVFVTDESADGP